MRNNKSIQQLVGNYDFSIILDVYHENMLVSIYTISCYVIILFHHSIIYLPQIKDDFLGRAMIHCDLNDTNPETQPYTVSLVIIWRALMP
jgi:hypothetical protein